MRAVAILSHTGPVTEMHKMKILEDLEKFLENKPRAKLEWHQSTLLAANGVIITLTAIIDWYKELET